MAFSIRAIAAGSGAIAALLLLSACEAQSPPKPGESAEAAPEPPRREAPERLAQGTQLDTLAAAPKVAAQPQPGHARPTHPLPAPLPGPAPGFSGERYPEIPWQGFRDTRDDPLSTFSIDVDTAAYVHVRRLLQAGNLPPHDAVRIEEMLNYFSYDYATPRDPDQPFAVSATVLPNPWDSRTRLLHVGLQGYDIPGAERPPLNLVLLVDVSGSMQGHDRLDLAKRAFDRFLDRLSPRDRVAIASFSGAAEVVLEPTRVRRKARIRDALDSLQAGGSTAGRRGLDLAYELAEEDFGPERHSEDPERRVEEESVRRVILISDGDFNVGLSDPRGIRELIARKRQSGIYLTVLTVGDGNVNDAIAQSLAQAGNGQAAHLDSMLEARKVLSRELEANLLPIADDVKIQVEFNPARVESYRLIGYETRALRDRDFTDDRVDAGDVGSGHQVTALYEIVPAGSDWGRPRPLRYQSSHRSDPRDDGGTDDDGTDDAGARPITPSGEYAYVQLRYKEAGARSSREMAVAVTARDALDSLRRASDDQRFAVAVAAFGQILRRDIESRDYGYDEVLALAESARGEDRLGLRSEFLQLVRLAESLEESRW